MSEIERMIEQSNRDILNRIDGKLKLVLKSWHGRDGATIGQRTGTPMPPDLIDIWTEVKWISSDRSITFPAKMTWMQWTVAKILPRLGLYIKELIPVEDILRNWMEDWEQAVTELNIDPSDRARILDAERKIKDAKDRTDKALDDAFTEEPDEFGDSTEAESSEEETPDIRV